MAGSGAQIVHRAPGAGKTVPNPVGGPITFKADAAQTGGAVTVFESTAAPGEGPPLHLHAEEAEILYVLEGSVRFKLDGDMHDGAAGTFVFVPRQVPHTWQNVGSEPARLLAIFTPSGMESFFEAFGSLKPDEVGPEAFKSLGEASGMSTVGPPLAVSDPL